MIRILLQRAQMDLKVTTESFNLVAHVVILDLILYFILLNFKILFHKRNIL